MNLPQSIHAYFDANVRLDADAMLAPFAPDAVVRDEGHTRRGSAAIRTWIEEASIALPAIAAPQAVHSDGDLHHVTASVAGNFPGSPVTLTFHFRLNSGRIAELEIK
jgi:ketosteroid isomerase-like protein